MTPEWDRAEWPGASGDCERSVTKGGCRGVEDRILDFLEGELPSGERRRIGRHLAECPRCAREASDLSAVLERVRTLPVPAASSDPQDGFAAAVRGRIAVERPPHRSAWQWARERLSDWVSLRPIPALSAAAVLGIMLAVGLVHTPRPPQPAPVSDVAAAGEPLSLAQNLDLLEQLDLLEELDLLEQLPLLRGPDNGRSLPVG